MTTAETTKVGCLEFKYQDCNLHIVLPSKRSIIYQSFKAISNPNDGKIDLTYMGVDSITKKWITIRTYGARIVENIVQAISRDLLAHSMKILKERKIVGSVHDELIIESHKSCAERAKEILQREMEGAVKLLAPLTADAGIGPTWLDAK